MPRGLVVYSGWSLLHVLLASFFFSLSKTWSHSFFATDWGYEAMLTLPSPCKDNLRRPDHAVTHTHAYTRTLEMCDCYFLLYHCELTATVGNISLCLFQRTREVSMETYVSHPAVGVFIWNSPFAWGNTWLPVQQTYTPAALVGCRQCSNISHQLFFLFLWSLGCRSLVEYRSSYTLEDQQHTNNFSCRNEKRDLLIVIFVTS